MLSFNVVIYTLRSDAAQNTYDARYLVERLDVGSGAALAHSFKRNPLRKAKSSIAVIAHKLDDKVLAMSFWICSCSGPERGAAVSTSPSATALRMMEFEMAC